MIFRLALRSLSTRPLRSAVLAIGFGLGIAVMAELLGVGEVILEQAHAPALQGGGDLLVTGAVGPVDSARFLLSSVLGSDRFRSRTSAVSPSKKATLYLTAHNQSVPIAVRGGVPSREKAVGDPEIAGQDKWTDEPADAAWTNPPPGDILRAMDRFHPVPQSDQTSWAEWLYFNGKTADGALRFYLTFLAGAPNASGTRPMFVRLQLNRGGLTANYSAAAAVDARELLQNAPALDVGGNSVRLDGSRYRLTLALDAERASRQSPAAPRQSPIAGRPSPIDGRRSTVVSPQSNVLHRRSHDVEGEIVLEAAPGRSLPPAAIHGARGWVSGYVVPVLSGAFHGTLHVNGEDVSVDGAAGYHDHNWGFWEDVRWQWGQVAGTDVSIVYGRVFPPAKVADASRIPGFLGVLGPDGPIAFSTDVSIAEMDEGGKPKTITVQARGSQVELTLQLDVAESTQTRMSLTRRAEDAMTFLQLGGDYRVRGKAAGRDISFTARGSAETFRTESARP
ncbi:MAG TPA: hypothetical protein VGX46_16985 [Vicinamibacterales bacterium]|nr:hypothetical protein [Vicinamibacterales bacterium]